MKKHFEALAILVAVIGGLIVATGPYLLQNIRIGLEFRGGYEILYRADSSTPGQAVNQATLLKTAEILGSRANTLGVSEPDVRIEGDNQIRVLLPGVSDSAQVRQLMNTGQNLPLKLTETYSQTVGGVLGKDDLAATRKAGLIALALIFLFVVVVYRLPGLVGAFSLLTYLWCLLLAFFLLNATLSLAAIVAIILGVGIAADSNILSFERIKEEARNGRSLLVSLRDGQRRAFRTIRDSNITTLIGAVVLFGVGIGPIRGFALTMILSIIASLLCNVFLSYLLLNLLARTRLADRPAFWGISKGPRVSVTTRFNFVKHSRIFVALSIVVALAGTVSLFTSEPNYDIDFKPGTALDITINQSIDQGDADAIISAAGVHPATIAIGGQNSNQIAARFDDVLDADDVNNIIGEFKKTYSSVAFQENTSNPAVAQELASKAFYATLLALLGIFVFVALRFGWRFAVAASVAIVNSIFFVFSMFSLFKLEVDVTFIAAILTVMGYATNDAIVIFDRIRENVKLSPPATAQELAALVNQSIWQTLRRSIYTVLTVITGAVCLYLFGAEPLQMFSLAILFGLVCGTYSSIFIATPVWYYLKRNSLASRDRQVVESSVAAEAA